MQKSWRDRARVTLDKTFAALPGTATIAEAKAAIKVAYPFGVREMHPYKIWCDESKMYLERRFPEIRREREKAALRKEIEKRGPGAVEANKSLFD